MDQEIPDYDMDSEDESWLNEQAKKMEITPLKFEEMLDRLEKGSGQQVVTLREAKLLLKEDDDLIIAVYDYWLNKRLRTVSIQGYSQDFSKGYCSIDRFYLFCRVVQHLIKFTMVFIIYVYLSILIFTLINK